MVGAPFAKPALDLFGKLELQRREMFARKIILSTPQWPHRVDGHPSRSSDERAFSFSNTDQRALQGDLLTKSGVLWNQPRFTAMKTGAS
jgi:hypothetical protein